MDILDENIQQTSKQWWAGRRLKYNKGLVIAGITAFILYVILGSTLIMPYDEDFEITLFTTVFQGVGYFTDTFLSWQYFSPSKVCDVDF